MNQSYVRWSADHFSKEESPLCETVVLHSSDVSFVKIQTSAAESTLTTQHADFLILAVT